MRSAVGMFRQQKILIVSYHFHPSSAVGARRMTALAEALRDSGHAVTVVAADVGGDRAGPDGIEVNRIPVPRKLWPRMQRRIGRVGRRNRPASGIASGNTSGRAGQESPVARLKRQVNALEWLLDDCKRWSFRALTAMVRMRRRRFDVVVSSGPPMSSHVAARLARPLLGASWIMDLRDPWVGNSYWPPAVRSALRDRMESYLERRCATRADWITVAAPGIGRRVTHRHPELGERVQLILNGYDESPAGTTHPPAGRLHLLYAGSLYFNRDPFPLLHAYERLVNGEGVRREAVHLTFVGSCEQWGGVRLSEWAEAHGIGDCVTVHAPVAPERLNGFTAAAHVLLVFAQAQPEQIPAKVYECIAAGREMLVIAEREGDTGRLVAETGGGRVIEPGDGEGLFLALRELYGFYVDSSGTFELPPATVARFSRSQQNRAFFELIGVGR